MKTNPNTLLLTFLGLALFCGLVVSPPRPAEAQVPFPFAAPTTPDSQRNAINNVRAQVGYLRNTTRTAPNFATGGSEMVWARFQAVRGAFDSFKATLRPDQLSLGANDLAELSSGLDILQEAFGGYQEEVAAGRSSSMALRSMCRVLDQAADVWLQEFNKDCSHFRAGWL